MSHILLGNIFSLLSTITDLYSVSRKTARSMLITQTITQALLALSSIILGGYSAVVQNVVSILRNLAALGNTSSKVIEYGLIVAGVVLGIAFNNLGLIGCLPVLSNLIYSISVFRFKDDEYSLKITFTVCVSLFIVFNFRLFNYVGAISNIAVFSMSALSLVKSRRRAQQKTNNP